MYEIEFQDMDGRKIYGYDFEKVVQGGQSEIVSFKIKNIGDIDILDLTIFPWLSVYQSGRYLDTVGSTFLSLDGVNFKKRLSISLEAGEDRIIYMVYQPRWMANPQPNRWSLYCVINEIATESTCQ